jgi:hypothetical protein
MVIINQSTVNIDRALTGLGWAGLGRASPNTCRAPDKPCGQHGLQ